METEPKRTSASQRHVFTEAECKTLQEHYGREVSVNDVRDAIEDIKDMLHTIEYLRAQLDATSTTISDQRYILDTKNDHDTYSSYQN